MEHLVLGAYLLCLSTGLLGIACLAFLGYRYRFAGRGLLIGIQVALLVGLSAVGASYYIGALGLYGGGEGVPKALSGLVSALSGLSMLVAYALALASLSVMGGRGELETRRLLGRLLAIAVLAMVLFDAACLLLPGPRDGPLGAAVSSPAWSLGGYILVGLALVSFGSFLSGVGRAQAPSALRFLFRAYALSTYVFAAIGPLEWALDRRGLGLPRPLSLDYLFFLAWNVSSVAAFARSLARAAPGEAQDSLLPAVPAEKARALGLTSREVDMALLIARGLSNKEIAAELGISASTVRTHIYNLYQKAGARSRVELLSKLKP